jgi:hypothetical protein
MFAIKAMIEPQHVPKNTIKKFSASTKARISRRSAPSARRIPSARRFPSTQSVVMPTIPPVGCVTNPYAKNYQPSSVALLRAVSQRQEQAIPNNPEIIKGTDPTKDLAGVCSEGYVVIGQSNFRGSAPSEADAIAHAKTVGADRVLAYKGLTTGRDAVSPTLPRKRTSVANDIATPLGPNGPAMIAGSAATTTFGAEPTSNVPFIVRYDTLAIFLVNEDRAFGTSGTACLVSPAYRRGNAGGLYFR